MKPSSTPPQVRHIVLSMVIAAAIWLATLGLMSYEPSTGGIDIVAGSRTFRDHCGACHIVEKGISTHHGPNLYDFGKIAGQRKPGMSAAEYILESVLDPDAFVASVNRRGMPRNLAHSMTPDELRNVVAYVASRGASPDFNEIRGLEIPDDSSTRKVRVVRRQEMELGERVLRDRGGCLQCHTLYRNAEYTVFAPALFGVGLSDEALLRESIVDPNKVVAPYHRWVNVLLTNGQVVAGKLIRQDQDRVVLLKRGDANDLVRADIPMSDIETEDGEPLIELSKTSPMPSELDKQLTEQELHALITMIRQLN